MRKLLMNQSFRIFAVLAFTMGMLFTTDFHCHAQTFYTNPDTNYRTVIEDDAGLLSDEEITRLAAVMEGITEYGNVAFKTISSNSTGTKSYAESFYKEKFGTASGTLFLIDMDNRQIWIQSDGAVYKVITKSYANTITDNVYREASKGDYFACANEAFTQIQTLLRGRHIMQPMKYISNALLAMILALLINFCYICIFSRLKKPKEEEIMKKIHKQFHATPPTATYTHQTKTYSPVSSGSDSGGSSSSSGSGGGGGSSSGGGGGHSF